MGFQAANAGSFARALAALCAIAVVTTGCDRSPPEKPSETPTEAPPASPAATNPPLPARVPALTRSQLVAAAAAAASAFAEGRTETAKDTLVGQRFVARIPFGCTGPMLSIPPPPGVAGWIAAPDSKTIQLVLEPANWFATSLFDGTEETERWEAVEGFWIPRPWLATDNCPGVAADPAESPGAASPQTVGLAAVFARGGSRIGRRDGRAYTFTVRHDGDQPPLPPTAGYHLVLAGRIAAFPDGRAFACRASSPDQRPVCIAAVELDRVAFEADGKLLSEWRPG